MSQLTHEKRQHQSLFGPIVLIAIGLFFLFSQINPLTDLHWLDVLRLWPLLLIFLGLNILVLQAPRPYNTFLSGVVAVVAVLVFGYVLLNGLAGTRFGGTAVEMGDWQTESIQFAAEDVSTAVYDIVIGPPGADIYALEDSNELIAGTVNYQEDFIFDTDVSGSQATVKLAPNESTEEWVFLPDYWREYGETNRWQVGLSPRVPAALNLEAVAGTSHVDLRDLMLSSLVASANAGETELLLPGGNYDADLVTNAAAMELVLPAHGRQAIDLQVNAGSVNLALPPEMEARIEVDRTLGSFSVNDARLQPVSGEENVWQTAGYDDAPNRLDLAIHIAVGAVTMQ